MKASSVNKHCGGVTTCSYMEYWLDIFFKTYLFKTLVLTQACHGQERLAVNCQQREKSLVSTVKEVPVSCYSSCEKVDVLDLNHFPRI